MEVSGRRQIGSDMINTVILCDPCKGQDEEENAVFYCTVCKSLMSIITDLSKQLQNTKKMALKKKDEVGHIHMEFVSEVRTCMSEINHNLDSQKQNTLKEAQNVRDKDATSTEYALMTFDTMIADLEEMSSSMEKQDKYKQQRKWVISVKKAQSQIKQYESLNAELNEQYIIREYSFRPIESIIQSIKAVNSLGVLDDRKKDEGKPKHDNRTEKTYAPTKSVSLRYVGEIKNSNVKVVDVNSKEVILSIKVPTEPWNITCVEQNQIVVTCQNKLVFIKVGKKLSVMKQVDIGGKSRGIVYINNTFIVSFVCTSCVNILDLDGHILQTIKTDKSGKQLFKAPCNIALNTDQKTLYVSDEDNHTVTSMDIVGNVLHEYTHGELEGAYSLAVAREDNIYIAGLLSNNIHIFSPQCTTIRVLQDGTPGMNRLHAVIYCKRDNKLYISHLPGGSRASNTVSVYQIE